MREFSPAKVNLFFRVLSKRPDGYHEVASLYTAVNFGDFLTLEKSNTDSFYSSESSLLNDSSNLIIKARDAFRKKTGIRDSISIKLEKNIPMGAGFGGGSSNAATVLWMMNNYFGKPLSLSELIEIGFTIGSDVPFFFSEGGAYCTGRGEMFRNINVIQSFWIAKQNGDFLATSDVYAACIPQEVSRDDSLFVNDLEPAAFRIMPKLRSFKEDLIRLGFSNVVMTGSGTAFVCNGDIKNPKLPNTTFNFVTTIQRDQLKWYGEK